MKVSFFEKFYSNCALPRMAAVSRNEEPYMRKLVNAFNPATVEGLMCRSLISVEWRGNLYDCDFNEMLEMGVEETAPQTIFNFNADDLASRRIVTGAHCFGCTAGTGSSCGGVITQ